MNRKINLPSLGIIGIAEVAAIMGVQAQTLAARIRRKSGSYPAALPKSPDHCESYRFDKQSVIEWLRAKGYPESRYAHLLG